MDRPSQGEPEPERVPESDPVPVSPAESETASPTAQEPPPVSGQTPVSEPAPVAPAQPAPVAEPGPVSQSVPDPEPRTVSLPPEPPADRTQPVVPSPQPPAPQQGEQVPVARIEPGPGYQPPTYQPGQGYHGYQQGQGYQAPADSGSWSAQPGAGYQSGKQPSYPAAPVFQPTTEYQSGYQAPSGYQPVAMFQTQPPQKKERPRRDPLAVALGNASLLSAGYWLLGRRIFAVVTTLVTVALILVLALAVKTLWFEFVVVGWWVALIVHGWFLAGGKFGLVPKPEARKHRLIALGLAVVVLAAFGLLRYDSARIGQDVTAARDAGSCTDAQEALDSRWFGHRVANAPLAVEGDDTVRACDMLDSAAGDFDQALTGDVEALEAGFGELTTVIGDLPGHDKMVGVVLDRFLEELPVEDNCVTATLTDALAAREDGGVLARTDDVVTKVAPPALVGCGDDLMGTQSYEEARDRYQQVLDDYPDHELAPKATEGVTLATQAIELANVRALMQTTPDTQPAYCDSPAPYSAAPPYAHPGPTPAITFGNDVHTNKLPWRVTDVANAVVVICAGETQNGNAQETCPYESSFAIGGVQYVTFFRIAIPVRMYEVRTGKLLADTIVEIGGASCPNILEYSTYISDLGPPSETYVAATDADVQNGFRWLFFP